MNRIAARTRQQQQQATQHNSRQCSLSQFTTKQIAQDRTILKEKKYFKICQAEKI